MNRRRQPRPNWDRLFEIAVAQAGLFMTSQGRRAGYSPQLLTHYVHIGRLIRLRRGVYRIVHFPAGEHEDLVAVWLWSERRGVFSHQTALALHGLSDALPSRIHLTLPAAWRRRRFRVPRDVVLHYADVPAAARAWFGAVPITSPLRTLEDCAAEHLSPDLLRESVEQALSRGLVAKADLRKVKRSLAAFDGASA